MFVTESSWGIIAEKMSQVASPKLSQKKIFNALLICMDIVIVLMVGFLMALIVYYSFRFSTLEEEQHEMIRRFNNLESQLAGKNLIFEKQLSALKSKDEKLANKNQILGKEVNALEKDKDVMWNKIFSLMDSNKYITVAIGGIICFIIVPICCAYQRPFGLIDRRAIQP